MNGQMDRYMESWMMNGRKLINEMDGWTDGCAC